MLQAYCLAHNKHADFSDQCMLVQQASQLKAVTKLCEAVENSRDGKNEEIIRAIAKACLEKGLHVLGACYLLQPVLCAQIGNCLKSTGVNMSHKLSNVIQKDSCRRYFTLIPAQGSDPAIVADLSALISKQQSAAVKGILAKLHTSMRHPQATPKYVTLAPKHAPPPSASQSSSPHDKGKADKHADPSNSQASESRIEVITIMICWAYIPDLASDQCGLPDLELSMLALAFSPGKSYIQTDQTMWCYGSLTTAFTRLSDSGLSCKLDVLPFVQEVASPFD